MDRLEHILNFEDFKSHSIDRSSLRKIYVEYDREQDLIDLRISTTHEIKPEEATTIISLLAEALRLRADFREKGA